MIFKPTRPRTNRYRMHNVRRFMMDSFRALAILPTLVLRLAVATGPASVAYAGGGPEDDDLLALGGLQCSLSDGVGSIQSIFNRRLRRPGMVRDQQDPACSAEEKACAQGKCGTGFRALVIKWGCGSAETRRNKDPRVLLKAALKTFPWSTKCPRLLMYHSIGDDVPPGMCAGLRVRPRSFDRQIRLAKLLGFSFVTASELFEDVGRKKVALTFDDGYADNYSVAYPIIKKHGVKATFFVTCLKTMFGDVPLLSREQLETLSKDPCIELGAHTANHILLDKHADEVVRKDVSSVKSHIEAITQRPCLSFSYPGGHFADRHFVLLRECGFKGAFTVIRGLKPVAGDPYKIHRTYVGREYGLLRFLFVLLTGL